MYVFFYDHEISDENPFSLACFSQWFPAAFTDSNLPSQPRFPTAEHYMMYRKALVFDPEVAPEILAAPTPAQAKALGRKIKGFDRAKWDETCDEVVETGNYLKFGQNSKMKEALLGTRGSILVEASETDRIWGIGYNAKDAVGKESQWGQNRCV